VSAARGVVPFQLRGYHGLVRVELAVNDEPVRLGHPLVATNFDASQFTGFPVLTASIEYSGRGLNGIMGWIQVIQQFDTAGILVDIAVDRFPLGPDDSPLYTYGYLPTFFDAPANPDHPDGTWRAETWLVAIPDIVRTRHVMPLAGFRWGYRLHASRPESLTPETLTIADWRALLAPLREEHPRWEFEDG
jgi:hypothetical protein